MAARPEAIAQLDEALGHALRVLDRLSGARRAELVESLQQLTDAVAAALPALSDDSRPPAPAPSSGRSTG